MGALWSFWPTPKGGASDGCFFLTCLAPDEPTGTKAADERVHQKRSGLLTQTGREVV